MACQGAKASELFGKTATATTREYGPLSRRRSSRKKKDILKIDWDLEKKVATPQMIFNPIRSTLIQGS